ncbi:MAG: TOBE domain-containing protein, partial [Anaerolineae bacterium]|nr:TOBE domain-containing protein [Anaerolineae bacterium]
PVHRWPDGQAVPARVYISEPMGKETLLTLEVGGTLVKAVTPPQIRPGIGDEVWIDFDERAVRLFDAGTENAIKSRPSRSEEGR